MKKILIREFSPMVLLILSLSIFIPLTVIGIVYNLFKAIYHTCQLKFWEGPVFFIKYILNMLYQMWRSLNGKILNDAIFPDKLANAAAGELVEDAITPVEDTLFGDGEVTISTAIGELEYNKKPILKFGQKLSSLLSKVLDKAHCIMSYLRHLHNKTFKLE